MVQCDHIEIRQHVFQLRSPDCSLPSSDILSHMCFFVHALEMWNIARFPTCQGSLFKIWSSVGSVVLGLLRETLEGKVRADMYSVKSFRVHCVRRTEGGG